MYLCTISKRFVSHSPFTFDCIHGNNIYLNSIFLFSVHISFFVCDWERERETVQICVDIWMYTFIAAGSFLRRIEKIEKMSDSGGGFSQPMLYVLSFFKSTRIYLSNENGFCIVVILHLNRQLFLHNDSIGYILTSLI